ncbi:putative dipeptidyl-aminopeptidase B, partial [Aureobasidium pullulans]
MAFRDDEEALPLTRHDANQTDDSDQPRPSASSISTTSLVLEHLSGHPGSFEAKEALYSQPQSEQFDFDDRAAWQHKTHGIDTKARRILYIIASIAAVGWLAALALFLSSGSYKSSASHPHDPHATKTARHGQKISLEQVMTGQFYPKNHGISWIEGAQGEDGLLLQWGGEGGRDYLVVEEVRYMQNAEASKQHSKTLMKNGAIYYKDEFITPSNVWPSADHKHVLVQSHIQKNWRHSNTGRYWIFDVESQSAEPLDPAEPNKRIQYASWSPNSDAVVFTRDNNMYIRNLSDKKVKSITTDGGAQLFYGVPDWVYEEEVFASNQATWWSGDGKYLAFLRTDEAAVPEYPVQYFFSRPSGKQPKEGEENYPEVRKIKYPKAGAPMSVVTLQLYDVAEGQVFTVPIQGDFKDKDRLITEVTWAGRSGKVIIRETNRESDVLKVVLIDAERREGKTTREVDVNALDGGWFEVSQTTTYIPSDPANGREHEGYIDTVIHDGFDHLAYFTPLDNPEPIMLTKGKWEVVEAPSALDLKNNLVYFVATKKSSIERHIYSVKLDASDLKAVTDDSEVEKMIAEDVATNHEYLPMEGLGAFVESARDLLFGNPSPDLTSRIGSLQTISGTGAVHLGARFLNDSLQPKRIWVSDPTWGNHHAIFDIAAPDVEQKMYPYYDAATCSLNFSGMMSTLEEQAQPGDLILLHACAHNPTGIDPTKDQWKQIADLCERKHLFPFFDSAYQGFASGDVDEDAWAVRHFVSRNTLELVVAQSFSKNFGLYGQRVGAFHIVTSSQQARDKALSHLIYLQRAEISNPPVYGARIVAFILQNAELKREWEQDLLIMSGRIKTKRAALFGELLK